MFRSRASLVALVAALATAVPAAAQGQSDTGDVHPQVLDLVFTVVSLDGSVSTNESAHEVEVTLGADVLFDFDKASLKPAARSRIKEAVAQIRKSEPSRVEVVGYTDSKGSNAYNQQLSERRAAAVASALRSGLGGSAPTLQASGRGEADPVAPNTKKDGSDNPRGRAKNRRVTVRFER
jgi:OmpA-OmpF porin, OOP family